MEANKKVLIAEDSSVIQNIAKKVLTFQNFDIVSAKNGKEVLKLLEDDTFDVILMDINMPKMNGMDCSKAIRELEDESKANIPIIAITGNAQNYTMDEFKAVGINEYMPKPIDFDLLVQKVKEVVV